MLEAFEGGTSVNTIAQSAKMLCEYRSDDRECLEIMKEKFEDIFECSRGEKVSVDVKMIGDRPCQGNVCEKGMERLTSLAHRAYKKSDADINVVYKSSSTDANIPLSLGIPAICMGVYKGGGAHTREEWIEKKSLVCGLEIALKMILSTSE